MRELLRVEVGDGRQAVIAHSTKGDGDLSPATVPPDVLTERRHRLVPIGPWHSTRQVHGADVVQVRAASSGEERPRADALVTSGSEQVIVVHGGDCVLVGLVHQAGAVGVAHAGWKGLEAGVIDSAAAALRRVVDRPGAITAAIGPHIHASHYEFGSADLRRLAARYGTEIVAETDTGAPALDLTAATRIALEEAGASVQAVSPECTAACAEDYWSHRARGEPGRIGLVAWLEPT